MNSPINSDIRYQVFTENEEHRFISAVKYKDRLSLLYSITKAQKIPFCSHCRFQGCSCFKFLKKSIKGDRDEDDDHMDYWERRHREPFQELTLMLKKILTLDIVLDTTQLHLYTHCIWMRRWRHYFKGRAQRNLIYQSKSYRSTVSQSAVHMGTISTHLISHYE